AMATTLVTRGALPAAWTAVGAEKAAAAHRPASTNGAIRIMGALYRETRAAPPVELPRTIRLNSCGYSHCILVRRPYMALTPSNDIPRGTPAPPFALPDAGGKLPRLADFAGRPFVAAFICNHCPYVKHVRKGMAQFALDYAARGLGFIAINANDEKEYP